MHALNSKQTFQIFIEEIMAGSINKVILVGNLGKDPEIRATQDGREIASFSIATSDNWKDKNTGERKEKTEWHRIVVFQPGLVDIVKRYIKKGSKLYVEGALQTRKWVDNNGQDRYSTEVVIQGFNGNLTMLDTNNSGNFQAPSNNSEFAPDTTSTKNNNNTGSSNNFASDDFDDDIPF
jgi:single-strand DNA-binding protein